MEVEARCLHVLVKSRRCYFKRTRNCRSHSPRLFRQMWLQMGRWMLLPAETFSLPEGILNKNQMTGLSSAQHNILRIPFWIHGTININKSQNEAKSLTSGMYMETLTLPRLRTGGSLIILDVTALTSSLCTVMSRRRKRQEQCDVRKYFWLRSAQWSKIKLKKKLF